MAKRKTNVKVIFRIEFNVVLDEAEKHRDRPPSWFYLRTERAGERIKHFLHQHQIGTRDDRYGTEGRWRGWIELRLDNRAATTTAANLLENQLDDPGIKIRKIVATHEVVTE